MSIALVFLLLLQSGALVLANRSLQLPKLRLNLLESIRELQDFKLLQ